MVATVEERARATYEAWRRSGWNLEQETLPWEALHKGAKAAWAAGADAAVMKYLEQRDRSGPGMGPAGDPTTGAAVRPLLGPGDAQ